jgi:ABC-type uncharacterized transport system substrate-binding protein
MGTPCRAARSKTVRTLSTDVRRFRQLINADEVFGTHTLISGLLLSYGPDLVQIVRQATTFADKILRGAKPGDLPVQQPTRFQLIVNQRAAKVLNINVPASFILRADEVIE